MDVHNDQLSFLALVFELCNASLKNHIFKDKKNVPWETKNAAVNTCQWGSDILDALKFIHSKKIVHRDLKLDNVLVSHLTPGCVNFYSSEIERLFSRFSKIVLRFGLKRF